MEPWAPISWGELIDKITILEIKSERLTTQAAMQNVQHELRLLGNVASELVPPPPRLLELKADLRAVNQRLWEIENAIRGKEAQSYLMRSSSNWHGPCTSRTTSAAG